MKNYRIEEVQTTMTTPTYYTVESVDDGYHVHVCVDYRAGSERFFLGKNIQETKRGFTITTPHLNKALIKIFLPRGVYRKVYIES